MPTIDVVKEFVDSIILPELRIRRPCRFVFFCGGKIRPTASRSPSLRDFLLRALGTPPTVDSAEIVCAEKANDLFKASKYRDLIKFEEDIAQISDLVLLVSESEGSLAELGAFSMNPWIAPRLLVVIRTHFYEQESFVRDGPIRFLENEHGEQAVSAYPWQVFSTGLIKRTAAASLFDHIIADIKSRVSHFNVTEILDLNSARHQMILIYWAIYVLRAAILSEVHEAVSCFGININLDVTRRFLYCMRVAGWIGEQKYGHHSFYYPKHDLDPLEYSFVPNAKTRDQFRWKRDIVAAQRAESPPPRAVTDLIGIVGA